MPISVSNLTKIFGRQYAVNDLSFEAKQGEILGFLGPNGAGKTTTMKMICCYLHKDQGKIIVDGLDTEIQPLEVQRKIGYLAEQNPLYKDMYVKEFLEFIASIHQLQNKKSRINEVIELTGLEKEQNKIIGTLSKGYKQRVGLAQAIIHDPTVLILDEPTAGLDMNQLLEIRQLIQDLGKEKTVIFSSHIMQEVEALCNKVVIINNGEKVADESLASLQQRMAGSHTTHILFERFHDGQKEWLDKLNGAISVQRQDSGWVVTSTVDTDIRPLIFKEAYQKGETILEIYNEKANVEDVFRQLTKTNGDD